MEMMYRSCLDTCCLNCFETILRMDCFKKALKYFLGILENANTLMIEKTSILILSFSEMKTFMDGFHLLQSRRP